MKKHSLAAILAATILLPSLPAYAGIPVLVDADPMRDVQWLKDAQNWLVTVQHYEQQIKAYKSQLATASGIRNIGAFVNEAKSLAADLKQLQKNGISLDDLLTDTTGSYSSQLNTLYSKYHIFDDCPTGATQRFSDVCKKIVINNAVAMEAGSNIQNKINSVLGDLSQLSNRVEFSADSKESQDLASSVQLKSVQLNALTTQWEMSVKQSEQRDKMLEIQKQQAYREQQLNAPVPDLNG